MAKFAESSWIQESNIQLSQAEYPSQIRGAIASSAWFLVLIKIPKISCIKALH